MGQEQSQGDGPRIESAASFPGDPDGFQRLWTPHRAAYISGDEKPENGNSDQCPFCRAPHGADDDGLIIARGKTCFALLNLYPYNSGHVLVCTYRHVSLYPDLSDAERMEMGEMTSKVMQVLDSAMHPHGFNLGMNQGEAAGAGIAAHIHQHIVPRWGGDANFFPIVAQVKAVPAILGETRAQLATTWQEMFGA
ncbi:MAG: HIT family protein [Ancrocorticia sp.]|uniref:HIT family protein n=1 Tax=Ancrocorticia sp. TaxID=2593684 RepID=UPI003F90637D